MSEILPEDELQHIRDLPLTSQSPAFPPDAMIACKGCSRTNPPNRLNCIYCGRDLDNPVVKTGSVNLSLRVAEDWEPGHNLILTSADGADVDAASKVLALDAELVSDIVNSGLPLPVLRLAIRSEADLVEQHLAESKMTVRVISDETLGAGNLPRRLRRIEFTDENHIALVTFNDNERITHSVDDVVLFVTGIIQKNETETRAKRKKRSFKMIDETSTSSDMSVIDIYARNDARGYRVVTNGFDFSSLGEDMAATAASNVKLLVDKLERSCRAARMVESYNKVSRLLEPSWPAERSMNFLGVRHGASASAGFSRVEISDNVVQFTKFSRMHFHLL